MLVRESHFSLEERQKNWNEAILSISGWRKLFSVEHHPESLSDQLSEIDIEFLACAAVSIGEVFAREAKADSVLILARDSRPTGKAIQEILLHGLLASSLDVRLIEVTSLPQALAYVKSLAQAQGFVYITASHNPPGYNGLKIGGGTGEIFDAAHSNEIIETFKKNYLDDGRLLQKKIRYNSLNLKQIEKAVVKSPDFVAQSAKSYFSLLYEVGAGSAKDSDKVLFIKSLASPLLLKKIKIACDFNGSARLKSIDKDFLKQLGVDLLAINTELGKYSHRIVPEAESLFPLRTWMEESQQKGESFLLAYAPDCDGDRGNVILPTYVASGKSYEWIVPDAQFTFSLAVISELSFLKVFYPHYKKVAVVTNDATSLRIKEICDAFGVTYVNAEVGEANVMAKTRLLQEDGYLVRIVGEGSNGGNITLPQTVRDPLATILSILKLLYLKNEHSQSLLETALRTLKIIQPHERHQHLTEAEIFAKLLEWDTRYQSTSSYEERALYPVKTFDQAKLKSRYEKGFVDAFYENESMLKTRFGISHFRFINAEGAILREGLGNRTGNHDGGMKVQLETADGSAVAFLWMRGSKTEPVFRIMADVKGSKEDEQFLLSWHRKILETADAV